MSTVCGALILKFSHSPLPLQIFNVIYQLNRQMGARSGATIGQTLLFYYCEASLTREARYALFYNNNLYFTIMDYKDLINSNEVVLIEFFATWCPHCQRMMPVVAQLRELVNGNVDIHQLDIDKNGDAANLAGAESVPTFIIYKDGKEQWRQSGEMDGEVLLSKIESYSR